MPKQKTHKGVKKRFRTTATGKVKHRQAGTSHLAARKIAQAQATSAWHQSPARRVHAADRHDAGRPQLLDCCTFAEST